MRRLGLRWLTMVALLTSPAHATEPPSPHHTVATNAAGSALPVVPPIAPGRVAPPPEDPLALARSRWLEGDPAGVVTALTPWLTSRLGPWGRTRSAGHLLLATAQMELGNNNIASTHFYRVRRSDGPLASYGAWYEALVDHRRDRHLVAVRECKKYRERWPDGPKADECLLLTGDAYAAQGMRTASVKSYKEYLELHPDTPRTEEINLAIALAVTHSSPERGIPMLKQLALSHSYPSTDLAVTHALAELALQGYDTTLPDDSRSRMRRAESLRRSGKLAEAWELFQLIADRSDDDPQAASWVEANEERFAWGTRNYELVAQGLTEAYDEDPDANTAWHIFKTWSRDGDWAQAAQWGRKGLDEYGSNYHWRAARDDVAWAAMLAGEYADAAERWTALGKRGGDFGRKARFYAAWSAWRGGLLEQADEAFTPVVEHGKEWTAAGYYWRAQVRQAMGRTAEAAADRASALAYDKSGWYTALLRSPPQAPDPDWLVRDGQWHGPALQHLPAWQRPQPTTMSLVRPAPREELLAPLSRSHPDGGWAALSWAQLQAGGTPPPATELPVSSVYDASLHVPDGYQRSAWYDPDRAAKDFYRFAETNSDLWPDLPAAYDLANAGLHTEATRLISVAYEEWRDVLEHGVQNDPRRNAILSLHMRLADWRPFLLFVRDHYHAARSCHGLWKHTQDEDARIAALRLAYPIVRGREIWRYARRDGIDPFLMLAIMRQESTYRNTALSRTGAVGLVQVMPRTGAKVAALLGERRYSPRDLEDPATNLRYGTWYFGQLMKRFDGIFPLAVASYNGGPHNMSRWYRSWQGRAEPIEVDALVEMIPFDESRDYVKRVTGHYARYVEIYDDAQVRIPALAAGDHPEVIDF